MPVYVDELHKWPTRIKCFQAGSCHMVADTPEELHTMAANIGLRRDWFQDSKRLPHYDLTVQKRAAALQAGAIEDDGLRGFISRQTP